MIITRRILSIFTFVVYIDILDELFWKFNNKECICHNIFQQKFNREGS